MKDFIKKSKGKLWAVKLFFVRHFLGNPSRKLKIVGVTGTNGKTTTVTLLYRIALALGYKAGLVSTVEILNNEEKIVLGKSGPGTTPDSVALTQIFAKMVKSGCEYVFMEVSSHAMDQNRVAGVDFVGGIFTNLTHDHLDYHKSMENYFLAKKKFFHMLSPHAFALSNIDDEHGKMMLEKIKAHPFLYGFNKADFEGKINKIDFSGLELSFNDIKIVSKLLGKFNAYNLLAVWSASSLLGFEMQKVNKILENIEPPRGRFDHFMAKNGVLAIVDYAHTPDAVEKILSAIKEIKKPEGRIICLLGCGGDRDPLKRRIMGKMSATMSDVAFFTSDNPRSEDPEKIIAEMKTDLSMTDLGKLRVVVDRHEAILQAVKEAKSGDIILCAGKGHEDYQEIKGVRHHFNDMEELKNAL